MATTRADGAPRYQAPGVPAAPKTHAEFIWSVADLLRGDYKRSEYGKVVLPLTVLRRLDAVLAPTKDRVLERREVRQLNLEQTRHYERYLVVRDEALVARLLDATG